MYKIDEQIKQEIFFEKYKYISLAEMKETLEVALKQLILEMDLNDDSAKHKRELAKLISEELNKIYNEYYPKIINEMDDLTLAFTETEAAIIGTALHLELLEDIFDPKNDMLHGYTFDEMFKISKKGLGKKIKKSISEQMILNENPASFYSRIKDDSIRLMDNQLKTAVRSFSKHIREKVKDRTEVNSDDKFIGWISLATLDSRTTAICISLDKVKYSKRKYKRRGDIPNRPPRHFNCRSLLVRQYKDNEPNKRASKGDDGGSQINFETSFNDFLKRNPNTAEKLLGKKRFNLFKSGKYEIKDFINSTTGQFFTIKEIKKQFNLTK